jgi:hypothetical protein
MRSRNKELPEKQHIPMLDIFNPFTEMHIYLDITT